MQPLCREWLFRRHWPIYYMRRKVCRIPRTFQRITYRTCSLHASFHPFELSIRTIHPYISLPNFVIFIAWHHIALRHFETQTPSRAISFFSDGCLSTLKCQLPCVYLVRFGPCVSVGGSHFQERTCCVQVLLGYRAFEEIEFYRATDTSGLPFFLPSCSSNTNTLRKTPPRVKKDSVAVV
jgi:hypothetical protein